MLETVTGYAPLPITLGAAGCVTCLLVLMGLKLKWFRARMTFDQPAPTQVAYVGVYRSTFSSSFDDFDSGPPPESIYSSSPPPYSSTLPPAFEEPSTSEEQNNSLGAAAASTLTLVDENAAKNKQKGAKPKEVKVKATPVPKAPKPPKEVKPKEVKPPKEAKPPKEVKPKEVKPPKEAKAPKAAKEPKPKKEPKVKPTKDSAKKKGAGAAVDDSPLTQNNAFPVVQASNGAIPKAPPMRNTYEEPSLPDDGIFTFVQTKSSERATESLMPPSSMKTFGSMQPTKGQNNTHISPIPQRDNRGFRNPAAMGMNKYVSPTESSMQMFYGMEEESES